MRGRGRHSRNAGVTAAGLGFLAGRVTGPEAESTLTRDVTQRAAALPEAGNTLRGPSGGGQGRYERGKPSPATTRPGTVRCCSAVTRSANGLPASSTKPNSARSTTRDSWTALQPVPATMTAES